MSVALKAVKESMGKWSEDDAMTPMNTTPENG